MGRQWLPLRRHTAEAASRLTRLAARGRAVPPYCRPLRRPRGPSGSRMPDRTVPGGTAPGLVFIRSTVVASCPTRDLTCPGVGGFGTSLGAGPAHAAPAARVVGGGRLRLCPEHVACPSRLRPCGADALRDPLSLDRDRCKRDIGVVDASRGREMSVIGIPGA